MKNIIWIMIAILVAGGLYFLFASGTPAIEPAFELGLLHPLDNVKGNMEAKVVLMEYSDFQCPACRTYYPIVRQIVQEFGQDIVFVYRHFPLTTIHPNAEFAARASEAAGKQGKFWEMHDLLFEKQSEWANANDLTVIFENYALLIGISIEQFNIDWRSKEVKDLVAAQRMHSVRAGLQGTPSFILNGTQIQNPASLEDFRNVVRSAVEAAS